MNCYLDIIDDGVGAEVLAAVEADRPRILKLLSATLADEAEDPRQTWQLTVVLVDEATCDAIHRQHFGITGSTDVMSFPDGSVNPENGARLVGDVVVCPAVALASTGAASISEQRARDEVLLYILHGCLHCLGFDDVEEDDRQAMWDRQRELLAPWGIDVRDE